MTYVLLFGFLLIIELLYFKVADRFDIVDRPNQRSSHTAVTLRGGGIVFFVSVFVYFLISGFNFNYFFAGLTTIAVISFLDDFSGLSSGFRIFIHFFSVAFVAYELQLFGEKWYVLLGMFILAVGIVNAYNFMDGINGMTAAYSFSVIVLLIMVNSYHVHFVDGDFLFYILIGIIVFSIFNFRQKAKCFAGDVGSVSIAFIVLFAVGKLIFTDSNPIYLLFLAIYGVDTVMTILKRLYLGQNIFEAHRSHVYQYLVNEGKVNKLVVASCYGGGQLLVGLLVISISQSSVLQQLLFSLVVIVVLATGYFVLNRKLSVDCDRSNK